MSKFMRIVIADDHTILREGLKSLIKETTGYQVVGEAVNGLEAIELAGKENPDIIIMDIAMPELDGLKAARQIKASYPAVRILILSMYADSSYVKQAFKANVSGFLLKETAFDEMITALERINEGKLYLSPELLPPVLSCYVDTLPDKESAEKYELLTPREKEILKIMIKGYSRQHIAESLYISLKTVDQHKKKIKDKLELKSEADLHLYHKLT